MMVDCPLDPPFEHRGDGFVFKIVESHLPILLVGLLLSPFGLDACSQLVDHYRTDASTKTGKLKLSTASKEVAV